MPIVLTVRQVHQKYADMNEMREGTLEKGKRSNLKTSGTSVTKTKTKKQRKLKKEKV